MSSALQAGALACTLLGLVGAAAVLARTRDVRLGVRVLLEFLLAGGLLRLSDDPSPQALLTAAALVAVRRVIALGLR